MAVTIIATMLPIMEEIMDIVVVQVMMLVTVDVVEVTADVEEAIADAVEGTADVGEGIVDVVAHDFGMIIYLNQNASFY